MVQQLLWENVENETESVANRLLKAQRFRVQDAFTAFFRSNYDECVHALEVLDAIRGEHRRASRILILHQPLRISRDHVGCNIWILAFFVSMKAAIIVQLPA
jgi:hypothetical protein